MKRYEIVSIPSPFGSCDGCLFYKRADYYCSSCGDTCLEPNELSCNRNIWVLKEIKDEIKD